MTGLDWRQQAEAAFRSARDAVRRQTGSPEATEAVALRAALDVAEPLLAAAERARIAAVIDPARLEALADWFDTDDEFKTTHFPETWPPGSRLDEVQQDLRAWAAFLRGEADAAHGFSQGAADAAEAVRRLRALGVSEHEPVYFAVDRDTGPEQALVVDAYLAGAALVREPSADVEQVCEDL